MSKRADYRFTQFPTLGPGDSKAINPVADKALLDFNRPLAKMYGELETAKNAQVTKEDFGLANSLNLNDLREKEWLEDMGNAIETLNALDENKTKFDKTLKSLDAIPVETVKDSSNQSFKSPKDELRNKFYTAFRPKQTSVAQAGGKSFKTYNDDWNKTNEDLEKKQKWANELRHDPSLPLDAMKTTFQDRLVFVAITYILRALCIYIMEWAIFTQLINTFDTAFWVYVLLYSVLFLLLSIVVNAQEDDKVFRLLLYYLNTKGENGMVRIGVHLAVQWILLPLPYLVSEFKDGNDFTSKVSFSERRRVIRAIERVSMISWLLTTMIALKL